MEEREVCRATVRVSIPEHCPRHDPEMLCCVNDDSKHDPCDAECRAEMQKTFEKYPILECCLMAPHYGYKHLNPRIQLTCGGTRLEIPGWSYYIEEVE